VWVARAYWWMYSHEYSQADPYGLALPDDEEGADGELDIERVLGR
jgi:hypothetical protein